MRHNASTANLSDAARLRCDKTGSVSQICNAEGCTFEFVDGDPSANWTIVLSHEIGETLVDPEIQSNAREIGDNCSDPTIYPYGQLANTGYSIQQLARAENTTTPDCHLQCSDTIPLCTVETQPGILVGVIDNLLLSK